MVNPVFNDYDGTMRETQFTVYPKDPLQRVQDYTKNISEGIFSPGVIPNQKKFIKTQYKLEKFKASIR